MHTHIQYRMDLNTENKKNPYSFGGHMFKDLEAHENKKQQHNSQEQVTYCKHFLEELGL